MSNTSDTSCINKKINDLLPKDLDDFFYLLCKRETESTKNNLTELKMKYDITGPTCHYKFENITIIPYQRLLTEYNEPNIIEYLQMQNFRVSESPHNVETCDKLQEMFPYSNIILSNIPFHGSPGSNYISNQIYVEFNVRRMMTSLIKSIKEELTNTNNCVSNIEYDITNSKTKLSAIDEEITNTNINISNIKEELTNTKTKLSAIDDRLNIHKLSEMYSRYEHKENETQMKLEIINLKKMIKFCFLLILLIFVGLFLLKLKQIENWKNVFETELRKF